MAKDRESGDGELERAVLSGLAVAHTCRESERDGNRESASAATAAAAASVAVDVDAGRTKWLRAPKK